MSEIRHRLCHGSQVSRTGGGDEPLEKKDWPPMNTDQELNKDQVRGSKAGTTDDAEKGLGSTDSTDSHKLKNAS
jgi:hypothetical protein